MRSEKQYENFVLHIEWMHMEPGGNSGVFVWSDAGPMRESRLPDGVEVQMLELDWPKLHSENGVMPPVAYVHGELFGVGGVKTIPDNPRGERSKSIENRCLGPRRVEHLRRRRRRRRRSSCRSTASSSTASAHSTQKKGYLCLESEGAEIHFRNIRIMELPPGVTTPGAGGA